jgi:probable HAF family extracellular repeat protein
VRERRLWRLHGQVSSDRVTRDRFDPPGSHSTEPLSINAKGEVVGVYRDGDGVDHGFLYNHGTYTVLDVPGALDTYAQSINDKGTIAGDYLINPGQNGGQTLGFLETGGIYTTIDPPGSFSTVVTDINDKDRRSGFIKRVATALSKVFFTATVPTRFSIFPGLPIRALTLLTIRDKSPDIT